MIGHISNYGYIVKYHIIDNYSAKVIVFKNGKVQTVSINSINILPIEEQIKEFNEYYFKFILPPDHLKDFVKSSPIENEAKK